MNEILKKLENLFRNIKVKKVVYVRAKIKPVRDWYIVLSVVFVFVVFLSALAYYFYNRVNKGDIFILKKEQQNSVVTINENLLKKTIGEIKERENFLKEFNTNKLIPPNPSN